MGYTNAGKSTLLNAFTAADAYVDDRLFATLDTKTRLVHLPNGNDFLLSDTVGFIRHLPHGLVASFRSTLEVASEADLLLVVADSDHPCMEDHLDVVAETLKEIDANQVESILVLNKCDTIAAKKRLPDLLKQYADAVPVSALRRDGLDVLKERIASALHYSHTHR